MNVYVRLGWGGVLRAVVLSAWWSVHGGCWETPRGHLTPTPQAHHHPSAGFPPRVLSLVGTACKPPLMPKASATDSPDWGHGLNCSPCCFSTAAVSEGRWPCLVPSEVCAFPHYGNLTNQVPTQSLHLGWIILFVISYICFSVQALKLSRVGFRRQALIGHLSWCSIETSWLSAAPGLTHSSVWIHPLYCG